MDCPALSCTVGLDRSSPVSGGTGGDSTVPSALGSCGALVHRGKRDPVCPIQQHTCLGPAQPSTEGSDRRGTRDRVAQHEVGKDSLRPEKAMSGGLESFAILALGSLGEALSILNLRQLQSQPQS